MSVVNQQPTEQVIVQQPGSFQGQPNYPVQSGVYNNVAVEPVVVQAQPTKNVQTPGRQYANKWSNELFDCTADG